MKIKQVIKETGLTDRAIRLYIENDLVKPEYDENYNGRKSIDFSEHDVEQLKNIALLRKADFSIPEIKALQMGGETAQQTVKEYINRTNEKIQFNTEIIEKIGTLADEENITIEIICEKLSSNLENEKVPAEDMEPTTKEKVVRTIFMIISIIGMALSLLFTIFIIIYYHNEFRYPIFYDDFFDAWKAIPERLLFVIQFVLCLILFLLFKKDQNIKKKKDRRKRIAIILSFIWALSWFSFPTKLLITWFAPPIYSQTTNPTNYLRLDEHFYQYYAADWLNDIYMVFPVTIPYSAVTGVEPPYFDAEGFPETTKYYYKYETAVETKFDLFAEWNLSEEEYIAEKERILAKGNITCVIPKGDWQCVYFSDTKFEDIYVLFFAYNDLTKTVRYVAMSDVEGLLVPHYTIQQW